MNYEEVNNEAKNTVGYKEAENKESFMVGVSVGFRKAEDKYDKKIIELAALAEHYKCAYENTYTDIKTLTNIIAKYE